jgi:hypothetical protein
MKVGSSSCGWNYTIRRREARHVVGIIPYEGGKLLSCGWNYTIRRGEALVMWLELYHMKAGSSCRVVGIIPYEGGKLVMWLELYHTKAGS